MSENDWSANHQAINDRCPTANEKQRPLLPGFDTSFFGRKTVDRPRNPEGVRVASQPGEAHDIVLELPRRAKVIGGIRIGLARRIKGALEMEIDLAGLGFSPYMGHHGMVRVYVSEIVGNYQENRGHIELYRDEQKDFSWISALEDLNDKQMRKIYQVVNILHTSQNFQLWRGDIE